jgi:hypothetical protein
MTTIAIVIIAALIVVAALSIWRKVANMDDVFDGSGEW